MDLSTYTTRSQQALAAAIQAAAAAGNPAVEPAHLLEALLTQPGVPLSHSSRQRVWRPYSVAQDLKDVLGALPSASGASVQIQPRHVRCMKCFNALRTWPRMGDQFVSTGHLVVGIATVDSPAKTILEAAGASADMLEASFGAIRGSSRVTSADAEDTYQALEKYGVDLTAVARDGKLDPVIGRDSEIRRVVQVLSRRTKNNPVLIGEPGVGKTAIVEGLAQRIVAGDVPSPCAAAASWRSTSARWSPAPIPRRIRGAPQGRARRDQGQRRPDHHLHRRAAHRRRRGCRGDSAMDAGNMLKPMLARGELR